MQWMFLSPVNHHGCDISIIINPQKEEPSSEELVLNQLHLLWTLQVSGCHLPPSGKSLIPAFLPVVARGRHQAAVSCWPLSRPRVGGGDEELLDGPGPRRALYGHGPLGEGR